MKSVLEMVGDEDWTLKTTEKRAIYLHLLGQVFDFCSGDLGPSARIGHGPIFDDGRPVVKTLSKNENLINCWWILMEFVNALCAACCRENCLRKMKNSMCKKLLL